jgi:hypothetical protein
MRRLRRRTREGCGFSSLMKQNKKAKNYAVLYFAGKKKLLFYIYAVIVKQKIYKRSTNHYWPRSGQARPQSKDSCPSYDDFSPGSTVRGVRVLDGVRWRK